MKVVVAERNLLPYREFLDSGTPDGTEPLPTCASSHEPSGSRHDSALCENAGATMAART